MFELKLVYACSNVNSIDKKKMKIKERIMIFWQNYCFKSTFSPEIQICTEREIERRVAPSWLYCWHENLDSIICKSCSFWQSSNQGHVAVKMLANVFVRKVKAQKPSRKLSYRLLHHISMNWKFFMVVLYVEACLIWHVKSLFHPYTCCFH